MPLIEKSQNRAEKNQRMEESRSEETCLHEPTGLVEPLAVRNKRNSDENKLPQNDRTREIFHSICELNRQKRSVKRKQNGNGENNRNQNHHWREWEGVRAQNVLHMRVNGQKQRRSTRHKTRQPNNKRKGML
jgi:hypothetical protein